MFLSSSTKAILAIVIPLFAAPLAGRAKNQRIKHQGAPAMRPQFGKKKPNFRLLCPKCV